MRLQLLLISDFLTQGRNVIKYSMRQGLINESYASTLCWPTSALCRQEILVWKQFMLRISRCDRLLLLTIRWTNIDSRHRGLTSFRSKNREHLQVTHSGQSKMHK